MQSYICMLTGIFLYITLMALHFKRWVPLTYQNRDYMGSLNKKASGAQCFIMALGLFWDIMTDLTWTPNDWLTWTPNDIGFLGPRGYCTFLPGAHFLTINSPDGADSLLNKLLLLLGLRNINCSGICSFHAFNESAVVFLCPFLIGQLTPNSKPSVVSLLFTRFILITHHQAVVYGNKNNKL